MKHSLEKRQEIADAYKALGVNINPLLLIQLLNDNSEALGSEDRAVKEEVLYLLETIHGITTTNGKLAVWLSGEKVHTEHIEKPDNNVEALIFKEAIALGWDCPRAAVLLIYRKVGSFQFTMQTVGRILRMPEQKHYTNPLLNKGYVYTNLSKDMIEIVDSCVNYVTRVRDKKVGYAQSMDELMRIFESFCMKIISGFESAHSLKVLTTYLLEYMERAFGLFETYAVKVILNDRNKDKFEEVIRLALDNYRRYILGRKCVKRERSLIEYQWEIPSERYYNSENHDEAPQVKDHALLPFIRFQGASSPEREFEHFLEENSEYIDWWYKNGDNGKQHYSIV